LGGAALVWLTAIACGDDGGVVGEPGGEAGEPAGGRGSEPMGQGGDLTDPGAGGSGAADAAGAGGSRAAGAGGSSGSGGALGDGGTAEPGGGAGGMAAVSTTVTGRILRSGAPIPGAVVVVDGQTTLSDEDGGYVVEDVSETYQLIVIIEDVAWVQIVDDLTTRTPVVNLPIPSWDSRSSTAQIDVPQLLAMTAVTPGEDRQVTMHVPRPASGDWNIVVPKAPASVVPLNDAASVTSATEFSWTDVAEGTVSQISWGIGGGWTIYLTTTATKATLPDLSAYGLDLEPGAGNSWSVAFEGPANSTDELLALRETDAWATGRSSIVGHGESRSFTLVE
jgi:hypothetical protein